jgi:hypothetical protein
MQQLMERHLDSDDWAESQRAIDAVPANLRRKDGKRAREVMVEQANSKRIDPDLPDVILDAAEHLKVRKDLFVATPKIKAAPRYIRGRRLYGVRNTLLEEVARWATERFRIPITPRFVERCLKEYRTDFKQTL